MKTKIKHCLSDLNVRAGKFHFHSNRLKLNSSYGILCDNSCDDVLALYTSQQITIGFDKYPKHRNMIPLVS